MTNITLDQKALELATEELARQINEGCGYFCQELDYIVLDGYISSLESIIQTYLANTQQWRDEPSEEMCDRARGVILGRDMNMNKVSDMRVHLKRGDYYTPIHLHNMQPDEHITKWDFAIMVWQAMNLPTPPTNEKE